MEKYRIRSLTSAEPLSRYSVSAYSNYNVFYVMLYPISFIAIKL